jgi:phosphoglycolate phosphatase-like HAD superfamily hydrolase
MTSIALNDSHRRDAAFRLADADAVLFDIDGTLVNSRDGVHYHAFHAALRHAWNIEDRIDNVPVHGNTDIGILRFVAERNGISPDDFAAGLPEALAGMRAEVARNKNAMQPEVCPSIAELLVRLREAGKLVGVTSGNLEDIGWAKLQAAGLREFFAFGSFSDAAEHRADIFRRGIEEARRRLFEDAVVCVVGDTPADVAAAKQVGVRVVSTATGKFDVEALRACAPDLCVSCCTELLSEFA